MNKIIRGRNNNTKKVKLLFIFQVVLGVMPVLLLIFFVWKRLYTTPIIAAVFILLIFLCNVAYAFFARQYAVLNSGVKGERRLFRTVKKLHGTNIVFHNLPVRYKRGRSELDVLIVCHSGACGHGYGGGKCRGGGGRVVCWFAPVSVVAQRLCVVEKQQRGHLCCTLVSLSVVIFPKIVSTW